MAEGKYDAECQTIQLTTGADTVVVVVINGKYKGSGFSVVSKDPEADSKLPGLFRNMADQIEEKAGKN